MSVQKRTTRRADGTTQTSWRVRWTEGDRWRSRTFDRKADALVFDGDLHRRRRLGSLSSLDAGSEALDPYVTDVWAPTFAAQLAPKTRATYSAVYDRHVSPTLGSVALRALTPEMIGRWQADRLAAGAGPSVVRRLRGRCAQASWCSDGRDGRHRPTHSRRLRGRARRPEPGRLRRRNRLRAALRASTVSS